MAGDRIATTCHRETVQSILTGRDQGSGAGAETTVSVTRVPGLVS